MGKKKGGKKSKIEGAQRSRSAIPQRSAKPLTSIHHTVQYPLEKNPCC
jgi:hypothetical protein